jgi:hypothetical protein
MTAPAVLSGSCGVDNVESKRYLLPVVSAISRESEICRLTGRQMLIIPTGSTVRVFIGMQNLNVILKYLQPHCDRKFKWSLATCFFATRFHGMESLLGTRREITYLE